MTTLSASALRAGWAGTEVVHGIDLSVDEGEIVLMLGPNGAGKSTTMLTLAGLVRAMGGHIMRDGVPVRLGSPLTTIRAGVVHVPEGRGLFHQLTARENLLLRTRRDPHRMAEALEPFPALRPILDRRAGLLSGGEQQMLAVACALALRPKVLLVDELTLGLAPRVAHELLRTVRAVADAGVAVLLVEQHVQAALEVADRAVVLVRGAIAHESSAAALREDLSVLPSLYLGADAAP